MKNDAIFTVEPMDQLNSIHEDIAEGHREQARNLARMAELQERLRNALRELETVLNHEHKTTP